MTDVADKPYRIVQHDLGYFEVCPKPSQVSLRRYYEEKYFQEACGSYSLTYSVDERRHTEAQLDMRLSVASGFVDMSRPIRILDVGCGEGWLLAWAKARGHSVLGLDFSDAGVRAQNPNCLPQLQTGNIFDLLDVEIRSGSEYHLVWLQNVLEHVSNPLELLHALQGLITADGILVVTVPNDFSELQLVAVEKGLVDFEYWISYPDHLNYFNSASLRASVEECGWKVAKCIADFPIDWFLFNSAANYVRNPQVGKAAHLARVRIENFLLESDRDKVITYLSAAAELGVGRNLTMFCSKAPDWISG